MVDDLDMILTEEEKEAQRVWYEATLQTRLPYPQAHLMQMLMHEDECPKSK